MKVVSILVKGSQNQRWVWASDDLEFKKNKKWRNVSKVHIKESTLGFINDKHELYEVNLKDLAKVGVCAKQNRIIGQSIRNWKLRRDLQLVHEVCRCNFQSCAVDSSGAVLWN